MSRLLNIYFFCFFVYSNDDKVRGVAWESRAEITWMLGILII